MSSSRKDKHGQVSVQINWIFVLIVGGIILIFFISLVMKQKTVSDVKLNLAVRDALDSILVSSQVASGTSSIVNVPKLEVEFDCNSYYVGDFETGIEKGLGQSRVIFVPSKIQGRKLLTWSLEWNLPFKVQDFLFLTTTEMRYIFVYDVNQDTLDKDSVDFAKEVFELMPEGMNIEMYGYDQNTETYYESDDPNNLRAEPTTVDYKNNYKTKFVLFNFGGAIFMDGSFDEADVSFINVIPADLNNPSIGDIEFYKWHNTLKFVCEAPTIGQGGCNDMTLSTRPYYDYNPEFTSKKFYPSLFGAIFTDNMEHYSCMYRKAFTRYSYITNVYRERIEGMLNSKSTAMEERGCISNMYGMDQQGTVIPGTVYEALVELDDKAKQCGEVLDANCNLDTCQGAYCVSQLVDKNKVIQSRSCPLVY